MLKDVLEVAGKGPTAGEQPPMLRAPIGTPTVGAPQACVRANQRQITGQGRAAQRHTDWVIHILKCGQFNV